jgi:hypothetical protein
MRATEDATMTEQTESSLTLKLTLTFEQVFYLVELLGAEATRATGPDADKATVMFHEFVKLLPKAFSEFKEEQGERAAEAIKSLLETNERLQSIGSELLTPPTQDPNTPPTQDPNTPPTPEPDK